MRVCVVYDWLGSWGMHKLTAMMRQAGVHVRVFNPPRLDSPLGWFTRDHRKTITVDGKVGFVSGLCVSDKWLGDAGHDLEPWRDTGVEIRGPAVAELERAFAQVWDVCGDALPADALTPPETLQHVGHSRLRVVGGSPAASALFRLDLVVASIARRTLWLTDAYFIATSAYVQALRAAARDGVDVRLLVPGASDIPALRPLSRAQYRPLLESGVRVFEWNGTMLHAKTAVADSRWARVGSTNLNIASWFGNCELDAVVEDESFARLMEETYLQDLENSTEVVLDAQRKVRAPGEPPHPHPVMTSGGGSGGRAAAGAIRIGNAIGAAFTNRRVLEPVEARIMVTAGALLLALAILFRFFPRLLVYPVIVILLWIALSLLYRGYKLHRRKGKRGTGALE